MQVRGPERQALSNQNNLPADSLNRRIQMIYKVPRKHVSQEISRDIYTSDECITSDECPLVCYFVEKVVVHI
jgi:hypothetical protein